MGEVSVILQGDPTLSTSLISLKAMWKALRESGERVLVKLSNIGIVARPLEFSTPTPIQRILDQFQSVFQHPPRLPPQYARDHVITLQLGTPPINVRLYRYQEIQKAEIECLVKEMLIAEIIQPSTSPFSSPILLVRKKDGG